jgi:hypothetical protein
VLRYGIATLGHAGRADASDVRESLPLEAPAAVDSDALGPVSIVVPLDLACAQLLVSLILPLSTLYVHVIQYPSAESVKYSQLSVKIDLIVNK